MADIEEIISKTEQFVRSSLADDATGHDWYHIERVRKNALYIYEQEKKGDPFVIEMAALLHDISDEKLNDSKETGEQRLLSYLNTLQLKPSTLTHIREIISSISFQGGNQVELQSPEAEIVQDADRLDALGAIGIARTFAYGGKKGQPLYEPAFSIRETMTIEQYRHGKSSSIHHFYEKLLKLKDQLNTCTARQIAERRHRFMELFLAEFYNEWNGKYEHDCN